MSRYSLYLRCYFFIFCSFILSCKKFVDVPPPNSRLVGETVYSSDATAAAAVTGIFQAISGSSLAGGNNGLSVILGLSGDELKLFTTANQVFNSTYKNQLTSNSTILFWNDIYSILYQANVAIESMERSNSLSAAVKQRLIAEARFVRAFCYFNLINLYGDAPLVTSSDYKKNLLPTRSSASSIYSYIVSELIIAESNLPEKYVNPLGDESLVRVRPSKFSAAAMLARVYLYEGKWDSAEIQSTKVIENVSFQLDTGLDNTFTSTSMEAIWQTEPINNGFNASDGFMAQGFVSGRPTGSNPILASDDLLSIFDDADKRRTKWFASKIRNGVLYNFIYKYKLTYTGLPPSEYSTFLRLSEQFLIRAEARAQQQKINDALSDLNIVHEKAGLSTLFISDPHELLQAIYLERRKELFAELGHRWFDLKRTGIIDSVMNVVAESKGSAWRTEYKLLPINREQLQLNANLNQNPGYE